MAVVEEWLSSTEPGLQIDSPPFSSLYPSIPRSSDTKKILLLTNHFKFGFQLAAMARICPMKVAPDISFPLVFVR